MFIRAHAVTALSKLAGSEDPDEMDPGEKTIIELLVDVLSYDPASYVRVYFHCFIANVAFPVRYGVLPWSTFLSYPQQWTQS